ncbi:hypothetical protein X797_008283 [Metarhizium robertsii]|uniref:Uncharacterized protein n=1 Tax=Metarhizium robertsii TaxID=568076 RepID=A0A014P708_9HYPO|nr:hypothetical protein X797_008283 [Metarhizium robertsii]
MTGNDDGLPQQYNALMSHHKLGYAFYEPESSLVVKPGSCGYIDGSGSWHPILNVASDAEAGKAGLGMIDKAGVIKLAPSTRLWGPKLTETVSSRSLSMSADVPIPAGIPATANALVEFELHSDFGAVLLCKGDVTKRGYAHDDPFRKWARANMSQLLQKYPTIRTSGFYVVTNTFTSKDILVNGWRTKSNKVHLGFGGGVESIANISANTEIYGATAASGWIQPVCKANEEKVVFFGGLKYEFHTLTHWMRDSNGKFKEKVQEKWRGDNLIIQDPDVEADALEVKEARFGAASN